VRVVPLDGSAEVDVVVVFALGKRVKQATYVALSAARLTPWTPAQVLR
jgi:hypothetical protein